MTVLSKLYRASCNNQHKLAPIILPTQGKFKDLFKAPHRLANAADSFQEIFTQFLEELPSGELMGETFENMNTMAKVVTDKIQHFSSSFDDIRQNVEGALDEGMELIKKVVIGALVLFTTLVVSSIMNLKRRTIAIIIGFELAFFGIWEILESRGGIESLRQWIMNHHPASVSLPTASLPDHMTDILTGALEYNNLTFVGTIVFSLLAIVFIGKSASVKNLEDFSKKIFNYQKGASATVQGFDLISKLWGKTVEELRAKFLEDYSEGKITLEGYMKKIDIWCNSIDAIVAGPQIRDIPLERAREQAAKIKTLYAEGLHLVRDCHYLDKSTAFIVKQYQTVITDIYKQTTLEPLGGEMRNPPLVVLLYGSSGAGKTTIFDAIKSIFIKVEEENSNEKFSLDNVYVRETSLAHWDGYRGQLMVFYDDLCCMADTLAKPNVELLETIRIKSCNPYPLPMSQLHDKGMFFTSKVMFCTTNVANMSAYIQSASYTPAITRRFADFAYKARVKKWYRKYLSPTAVKEHVESGYLDQHSVDPYRAQFIVDEEEAIKRFGNQTGTATPDTPFLLDTITDEQFEALPKVKNLMENGQQQLLNYNIYYFTAYSPETGNSTGAPIDWSQFARTLANTYRKHIATGEKLLNQQRALCLSSLESIIAGKVDSKFLLPTETQDDTSEEKFQFNPEAVTKLMEAINSGMSIDEILVSPKIPAEYVTPDNMIEVQNRLGYVASTSKMTEKHSLISQMWKRTRVHFTAQLKRVRVVLRKNPRMAMLAYITAGVTAAGISFALFRALRNNKEEEGESMDLNKIKKAMDQGTIEVIFRGTTLKSNELSKVFKPTRLASQTPQDRDPVSKTRVRMPTATANDLKMPGLNIKRGQDEATVECDPALTCALILETESVLDQMTISAIEHTLPANTYRMFVWSKQQGRYRDLGNVTFVQDKLLLMPYHYCQKLEYFVKHNIVERDAKVKLMRETTMIERQRGSNTNTIETKLQYFFTYHRILAPITVDGTQCMEKDAVLIRFPAGSISGRACANLLNKFITRTEMRRFTGGRVEGILSSQRSFEVRGEKFVQNQVIPVSNVRAVNITKELLVEPEMQGFTSLEGKEEAIVLVRDRYEYSSSTMKGDCGTMLWVDHPQLLRRIVGMHVMGESGFGVSVPVTRDDIEFTLQSFKMETAASEDMELTEIPVEAYTGPNIRVPVGDFHYLGELPKHMTTFQPANSALLKSKIAIHRHKIDAVLERKKLPLLPMSTKKPALLSRKITWADKPAAHLFFGPDGQLMRRINGMEEKVSDSAFNYYVNKGLTIVDPLLKGLEKCGKTLSYIDPDIIDEATNNYAQKVLDLKGEDPWAIALSQNLCEFEDEQLWEEIMEKIGLINAVCPKQEGRFTGQEILVTLGKVRKTEKFQRTMQNVDKDQLYDIESISEALAHDIKFKPMKDPMILTIQQAVKGIEGDDTIKPINKSNSPGWPFVLKRIPGGKKPWVGEEGNLDGPLSAEFITRVENLIEECKVRTPFVVYQDTLKDELRPVEKVAVGKTRVFSAAPADFSVVFRMYFMRFISHLTRNKIDNEICVGTNVYSKDWEKIARKLSRWGGTSCVAGDFANFDGSLSSQVLDKILEIVLKFYAKFNATEESQRIRTSLWHAMTNSIHLCRGVLYRWHNSNPSGNPITAQLNSMYNSIAIRMCYIIIYDPRYRHRYFEKIFPEGIPLLTPYMPNLTISSFDEHVEMVSYGDDNVLNINHDLKTTFNMLTISRALKVFNMEYTDEAKTGQLISLRPLKSVSFLKRDFKEIIFDDRKWIAPLSIETINEMLFWIRKADDLNSEEHFQQIKESVLREAVLHGEKEFQRFKNYFDTISDMGFFNATSLPTYEEQLYNVLNGEDPCSSF